MQKGVKVAVLFGLLVALAGCATMGDVVADKNQGTAKVYPVTMDQAWKIAKVVFRWEGAGAIEEHRSEHYMLTSSGVNLISLGAVMGAWIDRVDSTHTRVTVVTKRRFSLNAFTTLTETTFQRRFAEAVKIVKAGKPLPVSPPPE